MRVALLQHRTPLLHLDVHHDDGGVRDDEGLGRELCKPLRVHELGLHQLTLRRLRRPDALTEHTVFSLQTRAK